MVKRGTKRTVGNPMTIDELARVMQREFLGVHKKIHGEITDIREEMTDMRGGMTDMREEMRSEFTLVKKDIADLRSDFEAMKAQLRDLFGKIDELITIFRTTQMEVEVLSRQVRRLETEVAALKARKG